MQTEHISPLEALGANTITLWRLLFTDGFESAIRPGEADVPIREIDVPMDRRRMPKKR